MEQEADKSSLQNTTLKPGQTVQSNHASTLETNSIHWETHSWKPLNLGTSLKFQTFVLQTASLRERQGHTGRKYFISHIWYRICSQNIKNSYNWIIRQIIRFLKWAKDLNRPFTKFKHINDYWAHEKGLDSTYWSSGKCKFKPQWDTTIYPSEWQNLVLARR